MAPDGRKEKKWFVMRDLKRRNSNRIALNDLADAGLEVFTPMMDMIMTIGGKKQKRRVPVIQDLLFVHESKATLDSYVELYSNLQYRFVKGRSINDPMSVSDKEMERFIFAVTNSSQPLYYQPGEITDDMRGRMVRVVGGIFNGYEGRLLSVRGMRKKRLLVEIPNQIAAAVEIESEFIEFV